MPTRKVISFSDISAVNLMVGWDLLSCLIQRSTSFLSLSQREKISSTYRLHSFGRACGAGMNNCEFYSFNVQICGVLVSVPLSLRKFPILRSRFLFL